MVFKLRRSTLRATQNRGPVPGLMQSIEPAGHYHIDFMRSGRVHYDGRWMLGALVSVAVCFGIWKLHQRTVRTDLEPRLRNWKNF